MEVIVYASLKEHFKPIFKIEKSVANIAELIAALAEENPLATAILNRARFAVNDTFINHQYQFNGTETISIIPPSSGG